MQPDTIRMTIAISAMNCEPYLPQFFEAIQRQTLDPSLYQILLVDGGSSDGTVKVASQYGARVIEFPGSDPVSAKFRAFQETNTDYLLYFDHDEVIENADSLKNRLEFMDQNPNVMGLNGTGLNCPQGYPFVNQYINEFGDPFSMFIYRLSKDPRFFLPTMKRRYAIQQEDQQGVIFDFKKEDQLPIIELTGLGSMIRLSFFKEKLKRHFEDPWSLTHMFYLMLSEGGDYAVIKEDPIMHYSAETMQKYYKKIEWRVKNNVHFQNDVGSSGFLGRDQQYKAKDRLKKYLYIPYVVLILPLVFDTLWLCISRRDLRYTSHFYLSLVTFYLIVYHYSLKLSGFTPEMLSYDGKRVIK